MLEGLAKIENVSIRKYQDITITEEKNKPGVIGYIEETSIRSKLVLYRELSVRHNGCSQNTYVVDVVFEFSNIVAPSAKLEFEAENILKDENSKVLCFDVRAQIYIKLPKSELVHFLTPIGPKLEVSIKAHILRTLETEDEETWGIYAVEEPEIIYHTRSSKDPTWYINSLVYQANILLNPLFIKFSSQVNTITSEFAESAASQGLILNRDDKNLKLIGEIVSEFRSAVREQREDPISNYEYSNIWTYSKEDFIKAIALLPEDERKTLNTQFDQLWGFFDLSSALKWGENKFGAIEKGFEVNPEELEWVAVKLLKLGPLRSPYFEWLTLNALIYAETLAFGRKVLTTNEAQEYSLPEKIIKEKETDNGFFSELKIYAGAFWLTAKYLATEGLKIGITFAIGFTLTNENQTASWVITTGYTVFRWWRNVFLASKNPKNKELELLTKMVTLHIDANKHYYNPRFLRDKLYEVSKEGAVYSPLVFSILDLQIKNSEK